MGDIMKYSAGLMSKSFWFFETKKVAECILEGLSKQEIMDLALNENIFQVSSERRAKRMTGELYRRLKDMPEEVLESFLKTDINSARVFVLMTILKTDIFFFDFMHEVFREHIIKRDYLLKSRDFDLFFEDKKLESEIVEKWTDGTVRRLKSTMKLMLSEARVYDVENEEKNIFVPIIDYRFKSILLKNDLGPYIYVITGEK